MNPLIASTLIKEIFGVVKDRGTKVGIIGLLWTSLNGFVKELVLKLPYDDWWEYHIIMAVIIIVPIFTPVSWWEALAKKIIIVKSIIDKKPP